MATCEDTKKEGSVSMLGSNINSQKKTKKNTDICSSFQGSVCVCAAVDHVSGVYASERCGLS